MRHLTACILIFLLIAPQARAQQPHHDFHRDFYLHWKEPGTERSCCNARIMQPWGLETGDCEPAQAEIRNGDWWVYIRQLGTYIRVDDSKIVRERNPNGQDGHACWTPMRGLICFSAPDTGG